MKLYSSGVQAGAAAQRSTTLAHLLTYSLVGLAVVTLLAAVAGWIVAGRILRPVHRLTAAARAASEQNLSHRIALQGPRDELRELADTFDTMLERLDRAFTSQRQFIANASHELRTPLTVMRTAIDVVLAKPEPTRDELMSMAADVRQAVEHAERLIEALLVLARNDQARTLTDPVDLAAVAEDALEGRTANGITTITTLGEAPVTGDAVLLERLVANLLDNAERYNIAGGTVAISTTAHDTRPSCAWSTPARWSQPTWSTSIPAVHPARRPHPPRRLRARPHPRLIDRRSPRRHRGRNRHTHRRAGHHRPSPSTRQHGRWPPMSPEDGHRSVASSGFAFCWDSRRQSRRRVLRSVGEATAKRVRLSTWLWVTRAACNARSPSSVSTANHFRPSAGSTSRRTRRSRSRRVTR